MIFKTVHFVGLGLFFDKMGFLANDYLRFVQMLFLALLMQVSSTIKLGLVQAAKI